MPEPQVSIVLDDSRQSEHRADVVMDVGMHDGGDTARFLADGFKVVAIEANPHLVQDATARFASEIRSGQLVILGAAIGTQRGTASFGICETDSIWSTFDPEMIERNQQAGATYRFIEVETIPFGDVLGRFGIPHYLKIDIEGYDMLCVQALHAYPVKPAYISLESSVSINTAPLDAVFNELAELWTLGYRRFRYVNQAHSENSAPPVGRRIDQRWRSLAAAFSTAQVLRAHHNLGGLGGRWTGSIPGRAYAHALRRLRRPVGDWYDIVAAQPEAA
jgi:FkbM family methyltransferase